MQQQDLTLLLRQQSYPGRGIVMGLTPDASHAFLAYFIMGRSENSRNRVFTEKDGGIITEAADPAKLADPSLIIYAPVRVYEEKTIVTNGDQTDTVYDALLAGKRFEDALRTRTFEPDPPHFTPRISGMCTRKEDGFSYAMSILKSEGEGKAARRFFWEYDLPLAGEGHFIHTYAPATSDVLPSFEGEPVRVSIPEDTAAFGDALWENLNEDNKVSLFVRTIALDGSCTTKIYNRYQKA